MKQFIKTLALFSIPIGVVFLPAMAILFVTGEFFSFSQIEGKMSGSTPVVFGPAYSNFVQEYKKDELLRRHPEVAAVGASRVGGFRAAFFKNPAIFYNASSIITCLSDFSNLLHHMDAAAPKIIVASMDAYYFNPENAKNNVVRRPDPFYANTQPFNIMLEALIRKGGFWKVYADYAAGKYTLSDLFSKRTGGYQTVGLRAAAGEGGTTNDGSDYFESLGDQKNTAQARQGIHALAATITETFGDEYGDGISADAIQELKNFLSLAQQEGIVVIGFLPPEAHDAYLRHQQFVTAPYYEAFIALPRVLTAVYKEYGFDFYDFRDNTALGGSDAEMVEAKHGSEKLYLRLFIQMAQHSKGLGSYVDVPYLKEKLGAATSSYVVFGLER